MNKILILVIIICQLNCNNKKEKVQNLNRKTIEKFDLKKFNDKKFEEKYEYTEGDTLIKLSEESSFFKKELRLNNQNYKYCFSYDKKSSLLVSEFNFFYKMPIGTWNEYDTDGNLIKSKNHDENFSFTVGDLILKLKSELNIDLNDNTNNQYETTSINRGHDNEIDKYVYYINIPINDGTFKFIKVDGENGDILINKIVTPIE